MENYSQESKYLKAIECLGELLLAKDETIKYNNYEIERLKNKIKTIEEYSEYYNQTAKNE